MDLCMFQASWGYLVRLCQKHQQKHIKSVSLNEREIIQQQQQKKKPFNRVLLNGIVAFPNLPSVFNT